MENSRIIESNLNNATRFGYNFKNKLGTQYIYTQINGKNTLACERLDYIGPVVDIFRENGYSSIFFNPGNIIDIDNVQCYETTSSLDENSIKRFTTSRNSLNIIDIITDDSTFRTVAYSIGKCGIRHPDESFEPTGCNTKLYSQATGLPIIDDISSLKRTYSSMKGFVDHSDNVDEPPFIVMFKKELKTKENKLCKKTQSVRMLYLDKASFLAGEKPAIIMFSNVAGRNNSKGVFRRDKDGRYIDNGSYTELNGRTYFDSYPFDRVMDLAGDMVQPLRDDFMAGIRGDFETVIPKEYMDLSVSLLNRTMAENPSGVKIADAEPEI